MKVLRAAARLAAMLEMKTACQTCACVLASDGEAMICSYECTFCTACAGRRHDHVCPNCGGELVRRPPRRAPSPA